MILNAIILVGRLLFLWIEARIDPSFEFKRIISFS